jgi:circadian clock protein KaiC
MVAPIDASYLADAVVLMRYFETNGEVRQAISVVKKRGGAHERTIREFRMRNGGIEVGQPLREFRGILTGVPEIVTTGHDNGSAEITGSVDGSAPAGQPS